MYSFRMATALVAIFLVFTSCGGSSSGYNWITFDSVEGGFRINMPGKPVKSDKVEKTAFGKQVVHYFTWKPGTFSINKFKSFQISYTDCPARYVTDTIMTQVMLDSSIRVKIRDYTEQELKFENVSLNSYPGRAFFYDNEHGSTVLIVKECIANNRKYDLVVECKSNQGTNPEVSAFFDSFQLMK